VSVCVLTSVAQIIPLHTDTCNAALTDLLMNSWSQITTRSAKPSLLVTGSCADSRVSLQRDCLFS